MGQGIKYYGNYRTAPAVSPRMQWRATGGNHELFQGWLAHSFYKPTCGGQVAERTGKLQPPIFKESLSSAFSLQSHMLSFPFLLLYAHSSCDGTLQLIKTTTGSLLLWISYIYLKEGMSASSSCLFCDISYYNAQWTIVTISSSIHTFAISEVKLGLKHDFNVLNI